MQATQQTLLRPAGKERWQIEDRFADKKKYLMPLLEQLGLVDEVMSEKKSYDYVILLGFIYKRHLVELHYLSKLVQVGISFKNIVLLGSDRPLDPVVEPINDILNPDVTLMPLRSGWKQSPTVSLKTEMDMMKLMFDQFDLPTMVRILPTTFINTPMQRAENGTLRRANTADTIKTWLSTTPTPGNCLFISLQPFIGYQDAVIRTLVPSSFCVETIGGTSEETMSVYLDTLTRWLYQELQLRK